MAKIEVIINLIFELVFLFELALTAESLSERGSSAWPYKTREKADYLKYSKPFFLFRDANSAKLWRPKVKRPA